MLLHSFGQHANVQHIRRICYIHYRSIFHQNIDILVLGTIGIGTYGLVAHKILRFLFTNAKVLHVLLQIFILLFAGQRLSINFHLKEPAVCKVATKG